MSVLDQQVVQREREVPVDVRPVRRVRRLHDDRAVQPHLLGEVLSHVRVVPVEPGVGELHRVGERPTDRDWLLRLVRDPVVTVLQSQPVPMHRRLHVTRVGHLHGDLRALIHMQGRAGDRTGCMPASAGRRFRCPCGPDGCQVEAIAVAEPDDPLGNKPLIVVTAVKDAQAGWLPLQAEMLTLSTNSVQRVAQNATHTSLTEDKAEAVGIWGKAILDVVAAVRSGTPPTQ